VPPETPVDDQITETVPVVEDVAPEPTPADIVEIAPEEPTTVETAEASKPEPEAAQMDLEESIVVQEPEQQKTDEKPQQREGMHPFSKYFDPLLTPSLLERQTQDYRLGRP